MVSILFHLSFHCVSSAHCFANPFPSFILCSYGDEVEFHLVTFDPDTHTVRVPLNAYDVLAKLEKQTSESKERGQSYNDVSWHPEFGSWMIETTPSAPYGSRVSDLLQIEQNMRLRRARLYHALDTNVTAMSTVVCTRAPSLCFPSPLPSPPPFSVGCLLIPGRVCSQAFPLLGVGEFTSPAHPTNGEFANSDFVPDVCINPHPRFGALVRNIRMRRGEKVDIPADVFEDTNTSKKHLHMDCMAFGMGMCCLQVTFQACDIAESRHLYDQLAVLGPVLMALTAGTPILQGHLVQTDCRWKYIAASVDDRTPEERGLPSTAAKAGREREYEHMVGKGVTPLSKSRYGTISAYICNHKGGKDPHSSTTKYNDIACEVDEDTKATLEAGGVDGILANHLAHLWVRDPLVRRSCPPCRFFTCKNCCVIHVFVRLLQRSSLKSVSKSTTRSSVTTLRIFSRPIGRFVPELHQRAFEPTPACSVCACVRGGRILTCAGGVLCARWIVAVPLCLPSVLFVGVQQSVRWKPPPPEASNPHDIGWCVVAV